jgi:hypothetical protein
MEIITELFDFSVTVRYTVDDAQRSRYRLSSYPFYLSFLLCLTGSK